MLSNPFTGELKYLIDRAMNGSFEDVDFIIGKLNDNPTLAMTRFVDYSLGRVSNPEGVDRIRFYLFNGTQIQRNYASLFFNRRGDWLIVKEAHQQGLIDSIQAFAR
jgi:hypothetical protein